MTISLKKILTNITKSMVQKDNFVMDGELKTMDGAVAVGSEQASANNIPNLLNELRYSSGCMGSVNITSSYTKDNATISTG